ncbi:AraC family transcriptional regulator [Flavobacterium sp. NRK1]|uniref:helix-turn-helix domain-containing protein n=1 Tax=Flavobacterium sp. NRK1 TaxID=2954929 RepID=UPI002092A6B4|nr:helix-turn-helix domain-containing protein [Flavobacterium sp. NRK1]MCO6147081.1 helix-turn-helix domain-containing protein [Flavobacterium sp. NRK1]
MNYILFAGLLQTGLTILFIAFGKQKEKADYLLLLFLACIGLHLATKFYIFTNVANIAITLRMHTCIQLAYGPLLYLYARKKNNLNFLPAKMWYLFIPLIIAITLYICTSLVILKYPAQGTAVLRFYNQIAFFPIVTSHITFGIITPIRILGPEKAMLYRLKYILIAIGVIEIILVVSGNINPVYNSYIRSVLYIVLGSSPVIIMWERQQTTVSGKATATKSIDREIDINAVHERKIALEKTRHEEIFLQLEKLLQEKHLYKDEDLSLEKLANISGINRHHISETLNIYAKKPFYQYINEYRIQEVIHHLDNNSKKKRLLAIAYDSGFKTKASFNQYFKKLTGKTPSDYLKEKAA